MHAYDGWTWYWVGKFLYHDIPMGIWQHEYVLYLIGSVFYPFNCPILLVYVFEVYLYLTKDDCFEMDKKKYMPKSFM